MRFRVEGLRIEVKGLRSKEEGLRIEVEGLRIEVEGFRKKVEGLRLAVDLRNILKIIYYYRPLSQSARLRWKDCAKRWRDSDLYFPPLSI